jgi:hypothetical protein
VTTAGERAGRCREALAELAEAAREARALSAVLSRFAARLGGEETDHDVPTADDYPPAGRVLRALRRLDESRRQVQRAWDWAPGAARESPPSPGALAGGSES